MHVKNIWEPTQSNSLIHRLDPRFKLIMLLFAAFLVIIVDNGRTLYILFLLTLIGHIAARFPLNKWRVLVSLLLLTLWGSIVSQGLFYNQQPRSTIAVLAMPDTPIIGAITGGLYLYMEGLEYGAVQGLRSAILVSMGLLLCWSCDPREILYGLLGWRFPHQLSFMAVTALRFLPILMSEVSSVRTAQRLRCGKLSFFQSVTRTLMPVLANCLRRAVTLAISAESRGFRNPGQHTVWHELKFKNVEKIMLFILPVIVLTVFLIKFFYFAYYNGMLYIPELRNMYDWAKYWI